MKTLSAAIMLCVIAVLSFSSLASAAPVAPTFVTSPALADAFVSIPYEKYVYMIGLDDPTATFFCNTTADWLIVTVHGTGLTTYYNLSGIPTADDIGIYYVNLTATNASGTAYQNYTIDCNYAYSQDDRQLYVALIISIFLTVVGLVEPRFLFLAGIVWIFASVAVFYNIGVGAGWTIIGIGIGMILLIIGGLSIEKE